MAKSMYSLQTQRLPSGIRVRGGKWVVLHTSTVSYLTKSNPISWAVRNKEGRGGKPETWFFKGMGAHGF